MTKMLIESAVYEAMTQIDAVAVRPVHNDPVDESLQANPIVTSPKSSDHATKSLPPPPSPSPPSNSTSTSTSTTVLRNETPIVAVAFSSLEGNQWFGGVSLLDAISQERLCQYQLSTGVSTLAWCGREQDYLAVGCDNGDVLFVRVCMDVDYALLPQQAVGSSSSSSSSALGGEDTAGHDDVVTCVTTCCHDRTQVASSSWDGSVKLWDLESIGKCVYSFEEHEDLVWSVRSRPRVAHQFASCSQNGTVLVWDDRVAWTSGTKSVALTTDEFPVLCVEWHPHQEHVITTGLADGSLVTFDLRNPAIPLNRVNVHGGSIHCIKYSPFHQDLLLSASDDTTICLVQNLLSSEPEQVISTRVPGHSDYVRGLDWFQDASRESFVVSGAWDKTLRFWHHQQE